MKTVLITGATGFVGKQVFRNLSDLNLNLVPVVRSGKEHLFSGFKQVSRVVNSPDIFQETTDWWAEKCQGVDVIIHLAWYVEPGKYLQSTKNIDCLIGSLNLAKGAIKAGIKRFVGIGTCFEYDLDGGVLSVNTPLKPLSTYADSKASLFMNLAHWLPQESVEFAWCRLFYLYGDGEDERRLVPYIRKQLLNNEPVQLTSGKQVRDFLDVVDAGRMISTVALGKKQGPVNICSGNPITVRKFAEQISCEYGRIELLNFGVRPENAVDPPFILGIPNHDIID